MRSIAGIVRISTSIAVADDPRGIRAREAVRTLGAELEAYWRDLREERRDEARLRSRAARDRARSFGLAYLTNRELRKRPREDIVERLQLLLERKAVDNPRDVAAVMGGERRPGLRLSGLLDE